MLVAIPTNVFFRAYGEYGYLFNQINWTSALIRDVSPFRRLFVRHPVDLELEVRRISQECSISESVVRCDAEEMIKPLLAGGYLISVSTVGFVPAFGVPCDKEKSHIIEERAEQRGSKRDERETATLQLNKYFLENPTPFELCIDLTRACTERCIHCYVPGFQNVFLPFEQIEKVVGEFAAMGGLKVKLTGGECMLHDEFGKVLELLRAHDMVISVLSNLTCCDAEKAMAMKEASVAVAQVSLYGITPETHESVTRVKGSLAKTLQGIELLRSMDIPVQIHCPVLKQNVTGIDAVVQFGRERGLKTTFDAVMMSRADHGCGAACGLSDDELRKFIASHEDLSDEILSCPDVDQNERVCEIGTAKICLSAEGKYYPCNGCYGLELGDCRRQTLKDVWDGLPMQRLRSLKMEDLSRCIVCPNRAFCSPCPARNFNANGNVAMPDAAMCRAAACRREIIEGQTNEG